jgi:cupin superfamily acireductone dioxygenase involved in methionine salvage
VKCWHVGGVKSFKAAIFENQNFMNTGNDTKIDAIARHAEEDGWQPMVRSFSRRSGEHNYIFVRTEGKDLKMLILNLEQNEANVIQMKVDPQKLDEFMEENVTNHHHRQHEPDLDSTMMSFR